MADLTIWAMTSGEAGMRSQALGLAEAVDGAILEKTVVLRWPWRLLPAHLCPAPLSKLDPGFDIPTSPWPDLLITCGRRSAAVSIAIRRASSGRTRTVHIHNPQCPIRYFDLVVAMTHDGLIGDNVIQLDIAPHRLTAEKLAAAAKEWESRFVSLPHPRLGVLLGGASGKRTYDRARVESLISDLDRVVASGVGLLITPSRRTEPAVVDTFRKRFHDSRSAFFWDQSGDNPYLGILGLSDALLVSSDSVSMISEALGTGKPVATVELTEARRRHEIFVKTLLSKGLIEKFGGAMPRPRGDGLIAVDGTHMAAAAVRALLAR